MGAKNIRTGEMRRHATGIHCSQLPIADILSIFDNRGNRGTCILPGRHCIEHQRGQMRISDILCGHSPNAGAHMRAARTHADRGCGDRHTKHARARTAPNDRKRHMLSSLCVRRQALRQIFLKVMNFTL